MNSDITLLIASMVPTDTIVDDIKEAVLEFEINPTKESKNRLATICHMFIMNVVTDGNPERAVEIIDNVKKEQMSTFKISQS